MVTRRKPTPRLPFPEPPAQSPNAPARNRGEARRAPHERGQNLVPGLDLLLQAAIRSGSAEWFGRAFCSKPGLLFRG
jgi:hypothetical protein